MSQLSSEDKNLEVATLAGGCFWCTEAAFSIIKGVERIEPGYTGGTVPNPTYEAGFHRHDGARRGGAGFL